MRIRTIITTIKQIYDHHQTNQPSPVPKYSAAHFKPQPTNILYPSPKQTLAELKRTTLIP